MSVRRELCLHTVFWKNGGTSVTEGQSQLRFTAQHCRTPGLGDSEEEGSILKGPVLERVMECVEGRLHLLLIS